MQIVKRSRFQFAGLALAALCWLINGNAALGNALTIVWDTHKDTSITNGAIEGWHSLSTTRLCADDDGAGTADRHVATTLTAGAITGGWDPKDGGTSIPAAITSEAIAIKALAAVPNWGGVVTSMNWGGDEILGYGSTGAKKLLMPKDPSSSEPDFGVALAHEVGHNAGLGHNATAGFIMRGGR
ncbi:MAG: hypothetical protein NT031_19100, partial [Planctomycetota bacterium]|nr:hypothetical protein [Planctomycetota bacterium]